MVTVTKLETNRLAFGESKQDSVLIIPGKDNFILDAYSLRRFGGKFRSYDSGAVRQIDRASTILKSVSVAERCRDRLRRQRVRTAWGEEANAGKSARRRPRIRLV